VNFGLQPLRVPAGARRCHVEIYGPKWGDPASPVHLNGAFAAGDPPFEVAARVIERRAYDLSPVDPESEQGKLILLLFVWADQSSRLAGIRGAGSRPQGSGPSRGGRRRSMARS